MQEALVVGQWSPWIRVPAILLGLLGFFALAGWGIYIIYKNDEDGEYKYPKWLGFVLLGLALLAIPAYSAAWEERRVVGAFAEWFAAYALLYVGGAGAIAVGYFAGRWVAAKSDRLWLAWIVGIVVALVLTAAIQLASRNFPGVGWRIDRIIEEGLDSDDAADY